MRRVTFYTTDSIASIVKAMHGCGLVVEDLEVTSDESV